MLSACNPFENFSGEFYAGTVDPAKFPKAYLGGGDPKMGGGEFDAIGAFAGGKAVMYYSFPATASDPTLLKDETSPSSAYDVPSAYVFDPAGSSPFPTQSPCTAPPDYMFDLQKDAYALNAQGNIFTMLPGQSDMLGNPYVPVVAEIWASAAGQKCQSLKSADIMKSGAPDLKPDGNYLAWAVIDPSADVKPADQATFFGLDEHWGWYGHFLLAYVDGGYIPTTSNQDGSVVHAVTQDLWVSDTGMAGDGNDVFEHARGEAGYSPICKVRTYAPNNPNDLPKSVAEVMTKAVPDMDPAMPTYVYCLQMVQQ
jgi:hypothetical protein